MTTLPRTTTTIAVELSSAPVPTTTTAPPAEITREEAKNLKEDLVIVSASPEVARRVVEARPAQPELNPLEGLTLTFGSAVEALRTNLLSSIVLGVVLAVLLMLGVEENDKNRSRAVA
jgi:Tfp pilus assembly protein FimV